MGLSSLPAPSEGVLIILVVNTVFSITLVKEILRSILQIVGVRLNPPETGVESAGTSQIDLFPSLAEDFRYRIPVMLFKSIFGCSSDLECSVCLSKFEPEAEVNHLNCDHFFHKVCLEKWLDCWHNTCPLCRSSLMAAEEEKARLE